MTDPAKSASLGLAGGTNVVSISSSTRLDSGMWASRVQFTAGDSTYSKGISDLLSVTEPFRRSFSEVDQRTGAEEDAVMTTASDDRYQKELSAMEERMDKRLDRIEKETDRRSEEFRSEISLRDDTIRRELDLRRESFLAEQAIRDQAWEARFSGFLATQAERDKRFEESVTGIRSDLSRLGSLKLNIWGAMLTAVGIGLAVAALSVTFYQTGKADKPVAEAAQQSPSTKPVLASPQRSEQSK